MEILLITFYKKKKKPIYSKRLYVNNSRVVYLS